MALKYAKRFPTERSHFEPYSNSLYFVGLSSMESLTTASETLLQFRQLTDETVVTCQDVNELKHGGMT